MKPLTQEWVRKAEGDFRSVQRELRARKEPNLDGACFHAQQCAEKYLKARLQEADIPFPKTHDLGRLLDLVIAVEPLWECLRPSLDRLTVFSIQFRYPGRDATREMAKEALRLSRDVRKVVRTGLAGAV